MQAGKLEKLMNERKYDSLYASLDALVAEILRIVPKLPDGLNTERNKLYFLREAAINHQ